MLALWTELEPVVADRFRDGNVPAIQDPPSVSRRAFQALPETVGEFYFRGDAACYETTLLDWLREENRENGPQGFLGSAVSAPMTKPLKQAVVEVPAAKWETYRDDNEALVECAPVDYYPGELRTEDYGQPLSYIAIRVTNKQRELFADGLPPHLRQTPAFVMERSGTRPLCANSAATADATMAFRGLSAFP